MSQQKAVSSELLFWAACLGFPGKEQTIHMFFQLFWGVLVGFFIIPFTMQCHLASFWFGQCRVTSLRQNNKWFWFSWDHPDSSFLTDHTLNTLQYFESFPMLHSLSMAGTIKQWFHFFLVCLDLVGWFCFCFPDCWLPLVTVACATKLFPRLLKERLL